MATKLADWKDRLKQRFPRLAAVAGRLRKPRKRTVVLFTTFAHLAGALTSVQAIMSTRTSQGATAWVVSLNTIPYVAIPAYWIFGRTKFEGYITERRNADGKSSAVIDELTRGSGQGGWVVPESDEHTRVAGRLSKLPATKGNEVELLREGDAIFPSILEGIDHAQSYLLLQFYIVRDDKLGKQFQQHLFGALRRGVRINFIYDEIGSEGLPDHYIESLQQAGVKMIAFNSSKGLTNKFQVNFRNHRKMVVADGKAAWVGGANIGDEYTSAHKKVDAVHDTMVKVTGPAVKTIQISFLEDWQWASGSSLALDWMPELASSGSDQTVFFLPSGPSDHFETFTLYFLSVINSAKSRLWISTPYFIADEQIISALKLAALRGVDVRILIPDKCDSGLSDLSGWASSTPLQAAGVKFYRHLRGFMHQKIILVDSNLATVGTANIDNRSLRLNFEITLEMRDEKFAGEVTAMLEKDFMESRLVAPAELDQRGFFFRLGVRAANLLAPIQ